MPNGHDYSKEYGPHKYSHEGTSDCEHKCGCWMGPSRSDGPIGLDPFGECPNNPKDGKRLGDKTDHEIVVTRRIRKLESRAYDGEQAIARLEKIKKTPKAKLLEQIESLKEKLCKTNNFLENLRKSMLQDL